MRLVFVNRQGKIMVHELPKEDVDTCQALLNAFSHDNVLQYYKAVSEMDITKDLAAIDHWFRLIPDYKREGYLNLVDEILPDAFKVLKYGLCQLVKPHVPEELYHYLTSDEVVTRYCLLKADENQMKEYKYEFPMEDGIHYIRHFKSHKGRKITLTVSDYLGNEMNKIEASEGDLFLVDKGFKKVGGEWVSFGLEADVFINGVESVDKSLMYNATTRESQDENNIDPEKEYLEIREMFRLMEAKKDNRASKEYMEELERRISPDKVQIRVGNNV